jgi:ATP-binding cassette, subfamily B, multidrug efflux pump
MRAGGRIAAFLRPFRAKLALAVACALLGALLELLPPLLLRTMVDEHLIRRNLAGLPQLAIWYFAATAATQAAGLAAAYFVAVAAQGVLHTLRIRLLDHLRRLPVAYSDRTPVGDTIARATADVEAVDAFFSSGIAGLATDGLRLGSTAMAMVVLSPALAALSVLVIPPVALLTRLFQRRVRAAEGSLRRAVGLLNAHLQETLSGNEMVRAFGRERYFASRFRGSLDSVLAAFDGTAVYSALYSPVMSLLVASCSAALLWGYARNLFSAAFITVGTLTAFVLLFQRFFKPLIALGDEWQGVQGAITGAERIFEVLAVPVEEVKSRNAAPASRGSGIRLANVSFGYHRAQAAVLRDLSLQVDAGEHVALVGRTGAGKTSALHLAAGLHAPWEGSVRVAGIDPRALPVEERRRMVGVVPQVVQLFGGTVADNLTLGDSSVSREAIDGACEMAGALELVRSLPCGLQTVLRGLGGGQGVELSAGQRQLLALARALLWEPHVLLLDEATAAIDGASDAAFRAALRRGALARGCAVLSVAHRLSTAREADRVAVIERGRIVEMGPPPTLIRKGGLFAAWVELESAGWHSPLHWQGCVR